MNFYPYTQGNYKVVEINNVVALRTGQIIAQTVLEKKDTFLNADVIENGTILFLDIDGKLKAPADATLKYAPVLHYTEELFVDNTIQLNTFAVPFVDGVAYPRGLVLNVGDVFTTNNIATGADIEEGLFVVNGLGQFDNYETPTAGTPAAATFFGTVTTLPDGVTDALELTYIGMY